MPFDKFKKVEELGVLGQKNLLGPSPDVTSILRNMILIGDFLETIYKEGFEDGEREGFVKAIETKTKPSKN